MLALVADSPLGALADPDMVVVRGGLGTRALMDDAAILDWLRARA